MSTVDPKKLEEVLASTDLDEAAKDKVRKGNQPEPKKPVKGRGTAPSKPVDFGEL